MEKIYKHEINNIKEFQEKSLHTIRENQYLEQVDKWMRNIVYQDYSENDNAFHGTILCVEQDYVKGYKMYIYDMMYIKAAKEMYQDIFSLNKKQIDIIIKFNQGFHHSESFYEAIKKFNKNESVKTDKILKFPGRK
ncbi:hypothetical protein [Vallitalea guaymasensis]|uniref:hypothetical protein n=1 Tax=Vallitalea guaymasensis TaxID=1185412 RepID=UPI000DE2D6F0|nr:hypothetical protein [Vallitalea guaymasensis]